MDDARVKLFNAYFKESKPKWETGKEELEEIIDKLLGALLDSMNREDRLEKEVKKLYKELETKYG